MCELHDDAVGSFVDAVRRLAKVERERDELRREVAELRAQVPVDHVDPVHTSGNCGSP